MVTLGMTGLAVVGWLVGWVEGQTVFLAILITAAIIEGTVRE